MPRRVDHEERRRQLAEALWRLVRRGGVEAVSLSLVAAEAQVSKGLVQHYFKSRDQMLVFAIEYANERMRERMERRLAEVAEPASPRHVLRVMLTELLPEDEDRRTESMVGIAFFVTALNDAGLAAYFRAGYDGLIEATIAQLRAAQEAGEVRADLDPRHEADILLSLVYGLNSHILLGQQKPATALAVLDYHLDRLAAEATAPAMLATNDRT